MNQIIYIGPTIRGVVKKNQIFTYEPQQVIARAQQVSKYAQYLFVSLDEIVQKKDELRTSGTLLNIAYTIVGKEGLDV